MTLIRSISGIRGTIGGRAGEGLTPPDIVGYVSAYAQLLKEQFPRKKLSILTGRDARKSGGMVEQLVESTLISMGIDVYPGGLLTTPTVAMGVNFLGASGGIIITASHNPGHWNALKFLGHDGEFISDAQGKKLLSVAEKGEVEFVTVADLGDYRDAGDLLEMHLQAILDLPYVDRDAIRSSDFVVAVDAVNSVGGKAMPLLLEMLGVKKVIPLYCEMSGDFPHDPEPLTRNLGDLSSEIRRSGADLGFAVDPDVDRLAIIDENGEAFGEEYTLVAVADYILEQHPGPSVSNLSSTMALKDVTEARGQRYFASAVGEVNVVHKMKEVKAVIGGEGNGGVILPDLHYGRDALAGAALFLSLLAKRGMTCSRLRSTLPSYFIAKNKVELKPDSDPQEVIQKLSERYATNDIDRTDGLRINFRDEWVHVRSSNTEPVMRIYAESTAQECANKLAEKFVEEISRTGC